MRPLAAGVLIGALLALAGAARAAETVVSDRPDSVALTVYPNPDGDGDITSEYLEFDGYTGLALVTEWRTVDAPAGEMTLTFRGVAEGIVSETATLQGLPATLVEQNQDFDLLSPGSLIVRSTGAKARRIRTDRATGRETIEDVVLRSTAKGVVLEVDGRFEVLGCGGDSERLVFDRIPDGLTDRPTLSVGLRVREAGRYRVKLSYLAVGLLWQANYVALHQPDGTLDLTGWITLRNLSGTTFTDAPTQFVAGELEMTGDTGVDPVVALSRPRGCWPMDVTSGRPRPRLQPRPPASRRFDDEGEVSEIVVTAQRRESGLQDVPLAVTAVESDLGDYKLYTLPVPTTVAARQTKQVMMLAREGVKLKPLNRFVVDTYDLDPEAFSADEPTPEARPSLLVLSGKNRKADGLGMALPGGRLLLTERDGEGRLMMVRESALFASPVGAPVEILARGEDYEVEVRPRIVRKAETKDGIRWELEVSAVNLKDHAVAFELVHPLDDYEKPRIVAGRRGMDQRFYGFVWPMNLKPGERRTVRYTVVTQD